MDNLSRAEVTAVTKRPAKQRSSISFPPLDLTNFHPVILTNGKAKCSFFLRELCLGKAMVAYTKPQRRKREESERLRGE